MRGGRARSPQKQLKLLKKIILYERKKTMKNNKIKFLENVRKIYFGAAVPDAEMREKFTEYMHYVHYGGGVNPNL
jgi:hypothetical protein